MTTNQIELSKKLDDDYSLCIDPIVEKLIADNMLNKELRNAFNEGTILEYVISNREFDSIDKNSSVFDYLKQLISNHNYDEIGMSPINYVLCGKTVSVGNIAYAKKII